MSPSSGLRWRIARWILRLARVPGFALAFVLAGVFVGPWTVTPPPRGDEQQVLPIAAHEVLAVECQETPVPPPEPEDDEDLVVPHAPAEPASWLRDRGELRTHDALGPPTRASEVDTPPPRA